MSYKVPRIAIIGGGPSGLALLLTLHKRGIPATIYERDNDIVERYHLGGCLDLRWDSGQRALRENGLEEVFKANSRADGDFYRLTDKHATILLETPKDVEPKPEEIRPEIDRNVLRRILLDAVPNSSFKWGHTLSSARPLGNGEHELVFTNGTKVVCDVLIGADGAHSHIRPLVSPVPAQYTGINGAEFSLAPEVVASDEMADIRELLGGGTLFAPQEGLLFLPQLNGDGRVRVYGWHRAPEDWEFPSDPAAARQVLRQIFEGWAPVFHKMIDNCDERALYRRPLYMLPVGHRWEHVNGVSLIGDAAHLMTPHAGMGANLALLDGLECGLALAQAISAGGSAVDREDALKKWETEKLFPEGEKWARITYHNMEACYSLDAPATVVESLKHGLKLVPPSPKNL